MKRRKDKADMLRKTVSERGERRKRRKDKVNMLRN